MRKLKIYSFIDRNRELFDTVEIDGRTVAIPARIGSTYWAILKVVYSRANQPVYVEELAMEVAALMADRDPIRWSSFCDKQNVKPWRERLVISALLLTRAAGNDPYGLRVKEQGLVLELSQDAVGKVYLLLRTHID